jgi:hypothetical protein
VLEADESQGFLLLTDLGRTLYLERLQLRRRPEADQLMRDALQALVQLPAARAWRRAAALRRGPAARASWRCSPTGACSANSASPGATPSASTWQRSADR